MQTIIGPEPGPVDDDAVTALYPWPDEGRWVRAMMVTTLDGAAAGPDGLSGAISGDADQAVFTAVRRLADVVLIGAGTLRAERYGPMQADPADTAAREAAGQRPAPVLAIVSGSLDLPWDEPVFVDSTERVLVLTGPDADPDQLRRARELCDVLVPDSLEPADLLAAVEERGLRRVVCEGGPSLLAALVAADLVDEADITLSPTFAGTGSTPQTDPLDTPSRFELKHLLAEDSFLMGRYVKSGHA